MELRRLLKREPGSRAGPKDDMHLGEPGYLNKLLRAKQLEGLFLFVTSRCNSKCRTCFYADRLNRRDDLTFDQIRTLSETAPRFDKLWLSGGEPFLRSDLAEIIEMFHHQNGVKVINLPTNGLLLKRIDAVVERLLDRCPEMTIHLNFSLDGLGKTHDRIRGVPGNFKKTVAAMDMLADKYRGNPKLHRNVATVVTPEGYDDLADLGRYVFKKDNAAIHFYEPVRGVPRDPEVKNISKERLRALHDRILPLYEGMADRLFAGMDEKQRWFAKMYFMGVIKMSYAIQEENLESPSRWGMACTAGATTMVIDHDGTFRACELRPAVGHLRDYGYNLTEAMNSRAMRSEIEAIGGGKRANCWCTHTCWVQTSMQFSPRTLLLSVPMYYLRYRMQRLPMPDLADMDVEAIEGRMAAKTIKVSRKKKENGKRIARPREGRRAVSSRGGRAAARAVKP